jgi:hypothetical protein
MLGSNSRGLPDPEHWRKDRRWDYTRENGECGGFRGATNDVINALASPLGESLGGLFIRVVRGPITMSE